MIWKTRLLHTHIEEFKTATRIQSRLEFFKTATRIQSRPDAFDESRFVMT